MGACGLCECVNLPVIASFIGLFLTLACYFCTALCTPRLVSMLGAQTLEWCHEAAYSQHVSELDAWTRTSLWESLPWAVRENPAR
jgi:hypothetical protein